MVLYLARHACSPLRAKQRPEIVTSGILPIRQGKAGHNGLECLIIRAVLCRITTRIAIA